jgi:PPM family protein phosphatase
MPLARQFAFMAELPTINLALYAQTDKGIVRSGNEDNFLILDLSTGKSWTASEEEPKDLLTYAQGYYGSLLAVSDGMGGALAGEVASSMAVETVRTRMLQLQAHEYLGKMPFYERLRLSIEEANRSIYGESQTNPAHKGLGATFTAVATHANHIYFAQVGDSRAYLIRQGKIFRITKDQSLVQQLIDAGQITEEEAETHSYRNVILQALGAHNNVNVEVNCIALCQLDTLVLCSDGLSGKLHQDEIERIVNEASDFKSACQSLINLANERGGEDNITVVIAQFSGSGVPPPAAEPIDPQNLLRSPETPTEIDWGMGDQADSIQETPSHMEVPSEPDGDRNVTERLPNPPSQSTPFTAKLQRSPHEPARTNDLSDRRGPITAVFSTEDFAEDPELVSAQKQAQPTAQLDPRQTTPLSSASSTNVTSRVDNVTKKQARDNTTRRRRKTHVNLNAKKNNGRSSLYILSGLLMLGIAGLVFGFLYFRQQSQERTEKEQVQRKIQRENQNQKEGKIGRLREKIAEINKKLQTADKPALKEKREIWHESLNKLSLRLDDIAKIPPDQLQQISQGCAEIGKELQKIEDEVNNLQGLLRSQLINREPVKI